MAEEIHSPGPKESLHRRPCKETSEPIFRQGLRAKSRPFNPVHAKNWVNRRTSQTPRSKRQQEMNPNICVCEYR